MKNTSKFQNVVIVTIVGWLVLFVFLPNLMIIGTSFLTRDDASFVKMVFTLDNYTRLLDPLYFEVLLHSLNMALIATLACLVLGYPFAWFLAKLPHKVRPLLLFLLIVPFWTNSLIRIYGLKIFLSTKETGIKVIYSTYESNETMYAKLKTYKDGAYDLVVPSTYYVDKMRKEGMIQKIDKSKLSNFSNLDPDMLNKPFDPNNDYSIPYIWGATAIGVNGDAVDPKSVTSWADLWKPEYKGSLLLTDDAREVFQMALRKLGYSGNTTDPKEIEAAYNELKKLMPNVAAFNSDNPANPYMEGEVNLGMIWNGSAFVARQAGTPIDVVWPKEGGIFWMDSLAIPANAKNKEGALKLINFLLRPDVAKQVAETIGYPTPNLAARKLLSPEVANDKTLYPDAETIKNGEWQNDVGAASSIYEEYYQKLKAGR